MKKSAAGRSPIRTGSLSTFASLIDYFHNKVLSLSPFVGRPDQSLDIVWLTIKAEDQIDDTIRGPATFRSVY